MIAIILFLLVLGAGSVLLAVYGNDVLPEQVITCTCGKRQSFRLVIVDPIDAERISQALTEACATCQTFLRGRDHWERRYQRSRQPSAISRQPRSPKPGARSLTHVEH